MAYWYWKVTTATVISSEWVDTPSGYFSSGNYLIAFSYTVDGTNYRGKYKSSIDWKVGTTLPLNYNPKNTEEYDQDFRVRPTPRQRIIGIIVGIGLAALMIWWKSHK